MATKSEVVRDWQRAFPGMARWGTMRVARRVGPVVQGVALVLNQDSMSRLSISQRC